MRADKTKTIAAIVMMAGALLLFYFSVGEAPPKMDPRPGEALGQVLAEEAAKALGSGGRITLITRDTSTFKNPAIEFQLKSFYRALRKANLPIAATNLIALDPLRLVRVPPGDFLEIMRKKSENDVIVSFLGPPVLSGEQRSKLEEKKPRIVAFCSGDMPRQVNLRELFEQNLLQVAIIDRGRPASDRLTSDNLREWFDQYYQVVTPANLSALPPLTNSVTR